MKRIFTAKDLGCHADGAFGQEHGRNVLAGLLTAVLDEAVEVPTAGEIDHNIQAEGEVELPIQIQQIISALAGPMSDDDWETEMGTDILQLATETGLSWLWESGDLILTTEDN